jgi:NitT/TauT family transport system permease protein
LAALLALWQAAGSWWADPKLLPPPSTVLATLWTDFRHGSLLNDLRVSGIEFICGFTLGCTFGVLLGWLMSTNRKVKLALTPYVLGMYATPAQAFLPLLIIALGIGYAPKITLIALFTLFVVTLNTAAGINNVNPALLKVGRSFGCSRTQMFRSVILPAAMPLVVAGCRLGVGRAVSGVFLAEWMGASSGVGFYIIRSGIEFRVDRVFAGVLILTVFAVLITELISAVEDRLTPWRQRTKI